MLLIQCMVFVSLFRLGTKYSETGQKLRPEILVFRNQAGLLWQYAEKIALAVKC